MSEVLASNSDKVAVLQMDGLVTPVRTLNELYDLNHAMRLQLKSMNGAYDVVTVPRHAVALPKKEFEQLRFVKSNPINSIIHRHTTEVLLLTNANASTDTLLTTRADCTRSIYELLAHDTKTDLADRLITSTYYRRQLVDAIFEAKAENFEADIHNRQVTGLWGSLCRLALSKAKNRQPWYKAMREFQAYIKPSFIHWKDVGAGMIDTDVMHARSLLQGNIRRNGEQLRVHLS